MENRFKMRISRMFRGSFGSCRARTLSDVIEKAVFIPQPHKAFQKIEPLSPPPPPTKPLPFPSICRPKCPDASSESAMNVNSIIPKRKLSVPRYSTLILGDIGRNGHTCPPAAPALPLCKELRFNQRNKHSSRPAKHRTKKKTNKLHRSINKRDAFMFVSSSHESFYDWLSSDEDDDEDEDESDTLFSSRSLSSESSVSRRKNRCSRRKRTSGKDSEVGILRGGGKVKDSFAVVKSSSDPYNDFRTSMVEMIVERQIFGAKDLEQLLQCFLSLNSCHHHRIIVEVFTEIWEALFSNWS